MMKRIVVQKICFARLCTWLSLFVLSLLLLAGCHSDESGRSDAYEVWKDDAAWYQHDKPLDETQVAVSFNSVLSEDGIWPFVSAHPATCINPLNWRTDATPATMTYEGQQLTVSVDSAHQVLMVAAPDPAPFRTWMQENPVYSSAHIHPDCLHHWDLLFYPRQLHDNAVRRAYGR